MNFNYLIQMSKNIRVLLKIRRCYPWIMWLIWKNRNKFMFEAKEDGPVEIVDKMLDEVSTWFLA